MRRNTSLPALVALAAALPPAMSAAADEVQAEALEEIVVTARKREEGLPEYPSRFERGIWYG